MPFSHYARNLNWFIDWFRYHRGKVNVEMDTSTDDRSVENEAIWRAWVQKGKLREEAIARKLKRLASIAFTILAFGGTFYLLVLR
jgi:hypothetical protein